MKRLKVVTVCGCGLGSSLIAKMNIDDILSKHKINASIETADGSSALGEKCDLYVTTTQFESQLSTSESPVVAVSNLVNKDELEEKLMPVVNQLLQK